MVKSGIKKLYQEREDINSSVKYHSDKMNELPVLPDGRISDEYKETEFYKHHKKQCDMFLSQLKLFNSKLTNQEKRELSKYRRSLK